MKKIAVSLLLTVMTLPVMLYAQDFGFGFGFDDDEFTGGGFSGSAVSAAVNGEVSASITGYFNDFSNGADKTSLGNIFSGKLNFSASNAFADGIINLKLQPSFSDLTKQPVSIDEAYLRVFFGSLEIEAGVRKLTWGKADSFGPLDVINPLNYSDLTNLGDSMNLKIARPLVHVTYRAGSFSKIEAVFVPWFEPLRIDLQEGRWYPSQMKELDALPESINQTFMDALPDSIKPMLISMGMGSIPITVHKPPSTLETLEYAQAGVRFTTTVGPADIGFQYYYGRLTRPAIKINITNINLPILPIPIPQRGDIYLRYNPYHQIGVDYAQVFFGFNVRAEIAANITGDLKGDDGGVYNPTLAFSLGFDRDLAGFNFNFQINESLRLMNNKISSDKILDFQADTDMSATQVITAITRNFLQDTLETRVVFIWGIEDKDFLLMPSVKWTRDAVSAEFSLGIFGGDKNGQFGQYRDNSFMKAALTYSF